VARRISVPRSAALLAHEPRHAPRWVPRSCPLDAPLPSCSYVTPEVPDPEDLVAAPAGRDPPVEIGRVSVFYDA
jgi:hypothetical protein